jgi:hypothetical protein
MSDRVVPMIHVPDVRATVDWYREIGFTIVETFGNESGGLSFAILAFGSGQVMFNQDGHPSTRARREVDLYIYADEVDDVYRRLQDRVEVVEGPHDTSYGMREFIIRDLNRFWITFGRTSDSERLMRAVRDGDLDVVKRILDRADLKPQALATALFTAAAGGRPGHDEIARMLKKTGAGMEPHVDAGTLKSYVGEYGGERGLKASIILDHERLWVILHGQPPRRLIAVDATTFWPEGVEGATVAFDVDGGGRVGLAFNQGTTPIHMKKIGIAAERRSESHEGELP